MTQKGTLRSFQFFCTLFTCRIIALFTFIITDKARFPAGDRAVIFLPFLLTGLACALPTLLVIGKKEDRTIFTLTNELHPAVSKAVALVYALGGVWSAGVSLVRFDLFMSTAMYSGARMWGLIFLLTGAALIVKKGGFENVARMSVIVLAIIFCSLIYAGVSAGREFDASNLEPPLQNGVLPLIKNGFSAAARTSELASLLVLAPRIKGGVKKGVFFWFLCFGLTVSAVYTLILGVTGAYGERQMFQLYALTVLAKLGVIERLDALICAIWVLCSLVRLTFYLLTAEQFLTQGFGIKAGRWTDLSLSLPVLGVYLTLSGSVAAFSEMLRSGVNEIVFLVLLVAVPLTVFTACHIKLRARRNKMTAVQ